MQALFFLRKEKRWLVEKMVKEEYYEKESIIVKLMAGIHIFILIHEGKKGRYMRNLL